MVNVIDGIDVSKYQYIIDWKKVADSGKIQFAFAKATDGNLGVDNQFKANWAGIKTNGLIRGAYHFAQPDAPLNDPIIEADHFVDVVGPLDGVDMLCLDIEKVNTVTNGVAFTDWVLKFCERVESRTGVKPIIYSGGPFFDSHDGVPSLDTMKRLVRFPFWLAAYTTSPDKFIPEVWKKAGLSWLFWQKAGDVAAPGDTVLHLPGIGNGTTAVDHDVYRGTVSDLRAFAASLHKACEPAPVETPPSVIVVVVTPPETPPAPPVTVPASSSPASVASQIFKWFFGSK